MHLLLYYVSWYISPLSSQVCQQMPMRVSSTMCLIISIHSMYIHTQFIHTSPWANHLLTMFAKVNWRRSGYSWWPRLPATCVSCIWIQVCTLVFTMHSGVGVMDNVTSLQCAAQGRMAAESTQVGHRYKDWEAQLVQTCTRVTQWQTSGIWHHWLAWYHIVSPTSRDNHRW